MEGNCMIGAEPGEKGIIRITFSIETEGAHDTYSHLVEGANFMAIRLINDVRRANATVFGCLQWPEVVVFIDTTMGQGQQKRCSCQL
jgi:hypothetical protein